MKKFFFAAIIVCCSMAHTLTLNGAIENTNPCLAASYSYQEYVFPGEIGNSECKGVANNTAVIEHVYLAQTHVMEPGYPFFFLVANRPATLVMLVSGQGPAPDVAVSVWINEQLAGTVCLKGPATLSPTVDPHEHSYGDRFTVNLIKEWVQPGMRIEVSAAPVRKAFSAAELNVRYSPELNMAMLQMDILNYNDGREYKLPGENFLADFASEMPASRVRFGIVPANVKMPTMVASPDIQDPNSMGLTLMDKRLCGNNEDPGAECENYPDIAPGNVNGAVSRMVGALNRAGGDYIHSIMYGNTEWLNPGGWGGGKSFVAADFGGVMIHEAGHALSLPHWGQGSYNNENPGNNSYRYPYGGIGMDGGGRGDSWNFYQSTGEFITPNCLDDRRDWYLDERSDGMQRNNQCNMYHGTERGPWDGFSDFSSYAMFRFLTGAPTQAGEVPYQRTITAPYSLSQQNGYPIFKPNAQGECELIREYPLDNRPRNETLDIYIAHQKNVAVHTLFGTYHPEAAHANIIYEPMSYLGHLPRVLDPTDPATFEMLKEDPYSGAFWSPRDLTFRLTLMDGTVMHALYVHGSVSRNWNKGVGIWRNDLLYWAFNIPGDKGLQKIEMFHRPFVVRSTNADDEGNIRNESQGITAANFMEGATLVATRDVNIASVEGPYNNQGILPSFTVVLAGIQKFQGNLKDPHTARIYNTRGREIATFALNGSFTRWQLGSEEKNSLKRGVYLLQVMGSKESRTFRFAIY